MSTHILLRFSYPKQPGDTPWCVADVDGPGLPGGYVTFVPGNNTVTPIVRPSGGQVLFPSDFALQSFHIVLPGMASDDGRYFVRVVPLLIVDTSNPGGDAFQQCFLAWLDILTGVQVAASTDLSKSSVRLVAIGN